MKSAFPTRFGFFTWAYMLDTNLVGYCYNHGVVYVCVYVYACVCIYTPYTHVYIKSSAQILIINILSYPPWISSVLQMLSAVPSHSTAILLICSIS